MKPESPAQYEAPQSADRCPSCWVFSRWDKPNQRRCKLTHGGFDGTKESHIPFGNSCEPCSDPWHQPLSTSSQTPPTPPDLLEAAKSLLEWVPTCSVGSSGWQRQENLRKAIERAAQTPPSETAQDERPQFEVWANEKKTFNSSWNGYFYDNDLHQAAWQGWKARAALRSSPLDLDRITDEFEKEMERESTWEERRTIAFVIRNLTSGKAKEPTK